MNLECCSALNSGFSGLENESGCGASVDFPVDSPCPIWTSIDTNAVSSFHGYEGRGSSIGFGENFTKQEMNYPVWIF